MTSIKKGIDGMRELYKNKDKAVLKFCNIKTNFEDAFLDGLKEGDKKEVKR